LIQDVVTCEVEGSIIKAVALTSTISELLLTSKDAFTVVSTLGALQHL
jgi:hypothetical protein